MTREQLGTFVHHNPDIEPLITALNRASYTSDEMLVLEYAFLKEAAIENEMDELKTRAEMAEAMVEAAEAMVEDERRKAKDEKIAMVKKMFAKGFDIEEIVEFSGLGKEEILQLK